MHVPREHVKKKISGLFPQPPDLLPEIAIVGKFLFYMCKYICFLKQEKPEMDEVFNGYPCKKCTQYFAYSFVSGHSKHFSFFETPPPLAEASAKNAR